MKIKAILFGVLTGLLALPSCYEDIVEPVKKITPPVITNPAGPVDYVLIPENDNGTFETFMWDAAYLGEDVTDITYTIQVDLTSGDFTSALNVKESTKELWQSVGVKEMNLKLRELGVPPAEKTAVQVRIKAEGGGKTEFSSPVSFFVKRYIYDDEVPVWNIFGSATGQEGNVLMTHDEGNDTWSIRLDMVQGTFKFRDSSAQGTILGSDGTDNGLIKDGDDITIDADGNYTIVLDANALTYSITANTLPSQLYFVGSVNGWNPDAPYYIGVKDEGNGIHWGFLDLNDADEIKILTSIGSWDGYGAGPSDGQITEGGGNIVMKNQPGYEGAGQYIVKLDVKNGTIELVKITSVAVVGDGANGGWPEDYPGVELAFDPASKTFKGDVAFNATGEWKIRFNQTWTYNLGGTADNMTFDGPNFPTPGAVTKNVSVTLISTDPFSYSLN
jgi:hypothetical protein